MTSAQKYDMITNIDFELQGMKERITKPDLKDQNFAKLKEVYDRKMSNIIKVEDFLDSWFL